MVEKIASQMTWGGTFILNGVEYQSFDDIVKYAREHNTDKILVTLVGTEQEQVRPVVSNVGTQVQEVPTTSTVSSSNLENGQRYRISVKKYMTQKSTPGFDLMATWNNDIPMPLVTMVGTVVKQTRGMVYMELTGEVRPTSVCMCCGRTLTNPISRLYGIGPECGSHFYINPFNSEEELNDAMDELNKKMSQVKWAGWVVKSAIKECELV